MLKKDCSCLLRLFKFKISITAYRFPFVDFLTVGCLHLIGFVS